MLTTIFDFKITIQYWNVRIEKQWYQNSKKHSENIIKKFLNLQNIKKIIYNNIRQLQWSDADKQNA